MKKLQQLIITAKYGTHIFSDLKVFQQLSARLEKQFISQERHFFFTSCFLHEQLVGVSFNNSWVTPVTGPVMYRRVKGSGPGSDPLSIAGSLTCGGRLNMGGPQITRKTKEKLHPYTFPCGALYTGENQTTTRKEYGDHGFPNSKAKTYRLLLKSRKQLRLIDMDKAALDISQVLPALPQIVATGSMGGTYLFIKTVIPTQLFGHWLYQNCPGTVDGIIFNSTIDQRHRNYCLYLDDDTHCKRLLKIQ